MQIVLLLFSKAFYSFIDILCGDLLFQGVAYLLQCCLA